MREWFWRLGAALRRGRLMADRREELRFHLDMEIQAGLRRGLPPDEARRQAYLRAGPLGAGLESTRDAMSVGWIDGAALDLRHAWRALARTPSFGVVAIGVLVASVATSTLILCLLEGVVLRPLPYPAPERLVRLYDRTETTPKFPMAIGRFLDYRAHARSLEGIALYTGQDVALGGDGPPQLLSGVLVTSDFFSVLGHRPMHGRAFTDADLRTGVRHVILGARLWRERFGADPAIVGRTVQLDGAAWTVVGVAPEGFQHVGGDYRSPLQGETVDVWLPLSTEREAGPLRGWHFSNAVARLRPGVTEAQARDELSRLADESSRRHPDFGAWGVRLEPLLSEVTGRSRQVVWLLGAAGLLVLLVTCANIGGLCVARAVARRDELAIRRALGAGRWHLLRVGLAENLIVAMAGISLGLLVAGLGVPLLRALLPADFPRVHEVRFSPMAGLLATLAAAVTMLLAGVLPGVGREGRTVATGRTSAGREARRLRAGLVVGEVALAGLLCAAALFLLRSHAELAARDHHFTTDGVLTFRITMPDTGERTPGRLAAAFEAIRSGIAALPDVAAAGATTNLPWSGYDENTSFGIVGRTGAEEGNGPSARFQAATPGYFDAAGMRLIAGRVFDDRDRLGQPLTVIVNDALAERYFPAGDALGTVLDLFGEKRQIVGVVAGIRDAPADPTVTPGFWFPLAQVEFGNVFYAVRTRGSDPGALAASVTAVVQRVDPRLPVAELRRLDDRTAAALASRRFTLLLFQAFAALTLLLAAAGIYGLLAYVVRQRRKELSLRAALGATRGHLGRLVIGDGIRMAIAGGLVCAALVPLAGTLLQRFLYNVGAFDPVTLAGVPLTLLVIALLASVGPALAATRSDPVSALREE